MANLNYLRPTSSCFLVFALLLMGTLNSCSVRDKEYEEYVHRTNTQSTHTVVVGCVTEKPRGDFSYQEIYPEKRMRHLKMIGEVERFGVRGNTYMESLQGKILRSLRFQNIKERVERKYGLPQNFILAMVMQETGGADLLPNGQQDGGLGLSHMQSNIAQSFGLSTFEGCNRLICKKHGKMFPKLIEDNRYDRKKLIKYDDRFHPIYNLDAAGRMIACYMDRPVSGLTNLQSAIYYYAGQRNYRKYWKNINYYMRKLNDPKQIQAVRTEFNRRNPHLLIGGKPGNFDMYIRVHQNQSYNYGLREYMIEFDNMRPITSK